MESPALSGARRTAPAAERNRDAILAVLKHALPPSASVLEIASGTGQHAVHCAAASPGWLWQPSDPDEKARASTEAWRQHAALPNLLPPVELDVCRPSWPLAETLLPLSAIVCVNMIHIAPWEAAEALFAHAASHIAANGVLYLYGPFKRDGAHTAPSNVAFDAWLHESDPRWGVRDLTDVAALAARNGWSEPELHAMPANNLSVIFRKTR